MDFLFPAFLLLLAPAGWALWTLRGADKLDNALRTLLFLFVILALAQPRLRLKSEDGTLIIVADRSASMPEDSRERQKETIKIIEDQKGARQKSCVIGFSEDVYIEKMPDNSRFDDFLGRYSGGASKLGKALETAQSVIPKNANARILVLSDGLYTDFDPSQSPGVLVRGIPIDYRLIERPHGVDLAVLSLELPETVEPGEQFLIPAELYLPEDLDVSYQLARDNTLIAKGKISLKHGKRQLFFTDRISGSGETVYKLEISSDKPDARPENNQGVAILETKGNKPILHFGNPNSKLISLLRNAGIEVEQSNDNPQIASLSGLSKYSAVILENYPASKLGFSGQDALRHSVADLGKGLMMSGGRQSFGIGGYYKSPVAEILPVTMEIRKEHRKISTAVVVALDRSGSMAVNVSPLLTKMDLANDGTAAVLELLTDNDKLGVIAVDSQAHVISELDEIGGRRSQLESEIRSIRSMGGGIFIYEALYHAAKMISSAEAGTKHIILFADAQDSEEPGKYEELIGELRKAEISISVIGMGSPSDCDANLLKHIAMLGGGNVYFSSKPEELPQLFAQETLTISRNAFIEAETQIAPADSLPLLKSDCKTQMPPVGGYNLSYLRPEALQGIVSKDEFNAPIVAFWNKGNGRCLAFCAEADGKFSGPFGAWNGSGEILLSCVRWTANAKKYDERELFVKMKRDGSSMQFTMELDPDRKKDPFSKMPTLVNLIESEKGISVEHVPMEWNGSNSVYAAAQIPEDGTSHFSIVFESDSNAPGEKTAIPCTAQRMPYPPEFHPEIVEGRGSALLSKLAQESGGKERISLEGIFASIPPVKKMVPLWHILSVIALFILLLEICYRRTSAGAVLAWKLAKRVSDFVPEFALTQGTVKMAKKSYLGDLKLEKNAPGKESPAAKSEEPPPENKSISSALSEAKKRSRDRTGL